MDLGNAAQIGSMLLAAMALLVSVVAARSKGIKDAIEGLSTLTHGKAEKTETADLFARMRAAEVNISELQNEVEHLPDKDTAHRLEMAVARLEGKFETMDEKLKPIASIAERLQEVLLERGR